VGIYKRFLEERVEEELRWGVPLSRLRGLGSKVLVRWLKNTSKQKPGYTVDLVMIQRKEGRGRYPRSRPVRSRGRPEPARYPSSFCWSLCAGLPV
jgi:hypothetical protein